MYWNEQDNGLFRGSLEEFQSSECSMSPPSTKQTIFSNSPVADFVLEPEVFIYFTADQVVQFVGFDMENNGTIADSGAMLLESFGDATVIILNNITRVCNATTQTCLSLASEYVDEVYPNIDDIVVFRKSKQPLPGTCAGYYIFTCTFVQSCCVLCLYTCMGMITRELAKIGSERVQLSFRD